MKQTNTTGIDGTASTLYYENTPDECPQCHRGVHPRLVAASIRGIFNNENSELQIIFQCTRTQCESAFLGYYNFKGTSPLTGGPYYALSRVAPLKPQETKFSESITEVSPNFIEIYNQALAAEANNLDEMTGIGLRKALEFLIKDFLIQQEPTKADEIKGKLLGRCIDEHITDQNIKSTAKLATWLGNDETHYVRKWEDKDIDDLRIVIRLTVNWIDNVLLTQKYVKSMNP